MNRRSKQKPVRYDREASQRLWWEAQHEITPRAISLYAAAWGVLLSAETATAISSICTTIEKGHHP